jgi:DNA invertase Pin-like site-specific DNA recombinase
VVAAAYIRKSVVQAGAVTLSWEIQEAEVEALAARHGDTRLQVYSDWGRSGRGEKTHLRRGYLELVAAVEKGHVDAVYAYSLSRLTRSIVEYARLAELCQARGVRIRTCKEGETDFSTAAGRVVARILAVVAQMEAELAQERGRDMVRARRARGDRIGRQPYGERDGEDLGAVVAAWGRARSLHGAARILNADRVPTRAGTLWRSNSVRSVLATSAPSLLPSRPSPRVAPASNARLARLLRCHCGSLLTPTRNHGGLRYRCSRAMDDPSHGAQSVAESIVLPWVAAELELVEPPFEEVSLAEERGGRRDAVAELRRRNLVAYLAGDLDDAQYAEAKAALDDELEAIDAEGRAIAMDMRPDWEGDDPRLLNEWARSVLEYVQLDARMRPAFAKWRLPAWRRGGAPTR